MGQLYTLQTAMDTRPIHAHFFRQLTPPGYAYFAGHYRGEDYPALKQCRSGVTGDDRVGVNAEIVIARMQQLGEQIRYGMSILDNARSLSSVDHLLNTVTFSCQIFDQFLRIHPYVNGNGHIARFLLWTILGRYHYWLQTFPIEPRPDQLTYLDAILRYREGDKQALEGYVLRCMLPQ
jgi:fido (protein-threonine AMPylation protein)